MSASTVPTTIEVGAPVLFEGLPHKVVVVTTDRVEFVSEMTVPDGRPRFRTVASIADMLFSSRLNAWYVWGRVLSKGRGGVGEDQRAIVSRLRDAAVIPARDGRQHGAGPAAGEQHGLYADLFVGDKVNWHQELRGISLGEGLSDSAKSSVSSHVSGFKSKKLNHGFATRNDGDPSFVAAKGA